MIIGIIGGGQLARMLALAGYPLGLRSLVLDPSPEACAGQVAELLQGDYSESTALEQLAARSDLVTFDFENVPVEAARFLERHVPVFPPAGALSAAQDRVAEKSLFRELGIPTPPFAAIDSRRELHEAVARLGLPAVLKTRRLGYDGKGQRLLRQREEVDSAWDALGGVAQILEGFVPFEREVSVLALRARQGDTAFYPLVENRHEGGILRSAAAPCRAPDLEAEARDYANRLLERLNYVGLLAVEFFVMEGRLLANEMAPRVHNSGHWTIEGAEVSQFENHLRAILGLPLGSTAALGHSTMLNFIGELPDRAAVLAIPGAHFHAYGKPARPGRKVGHATVRAETPVGLQAALARLTPLVEPSE